MVQKYANAVSALAIATVLATSASAQTVTLQSVDGNVSIQGTLLAFDGENYDLSSSIIGRNLIPASRVICIGDACPVIDGGGPLSGSVAILDKPSMLLLSGMMNAYGVQNDLQVELDGADLNATAFTIADPEFDESGTLDIVEPDQRAAFTALLRDEVQFVVSTAPISDDLADELVAQNFPDLRAPGREIVIALDAIVPTVHSANTVRDLSLPTLAQIAAGRITNWSELGGADQEIRMVLPADGTSIAELFDERVMRPNRLRLNRSLERVANEAEAAAIVSEDPAALTLSSNALINNAKPLPIRQVCGPLSVPTDFSIKAEEYPLARRVLLYTSGGELPQRMKELLSFAGSATAQAQYVDAGFVGQTVENVPMSLQGTRLASAILQSETAQEFEATRELTRTLTFADRLSTTFRFEPGTTELDNKSRRDAVRIAEFLVLPENIKREILLFGFTDSIGRDDLNDRLSLQQAVSISQAIISASSGRITQDRFGIASFGAIAPVGCNDTVEGRTSNRRVEVWLR